MDELSYSIYQPVIFAALIAAVIAVSGAVVRARGNNEGADRLLDIAFGVSLLGGVYVAVLLLITIFSEPDVLYDAVVILLVIAVFFLVVLGLLLMIFEFLLGRGVRSRPPPRESD